MDTKKGQFINKTGLMVSLVAQQSEGMLKEQVKLALEAGVAPVEIKEALYHGSPMCDFQESGMQEN